MAARFECDVGCGTVYVTGIAERHDFGVRLPHRLRETRADLFVASH
jgi:hypothetical protein